MVGLNPPELKPVGVVGVVWVDEPKTIRRVEENRRDPSRLLFAYYKGD